MLLERIHSTIEKIEPSVAQQPLSAPFRALALIIEEELKAMRTEIHKIKARGQDE